MADDAEKRRIHQKLLIEISENVDQTEGSQEFEYFDTALGNHLPKGIRARNPTIITKLQALTTRGLLKPGDYGILKQIAEDAKNEEITQLIKKAEREMEQTSHGASSTTRPAKMEAKRKPELSTYVHYKQPTQVSQGEEPSSSKRQRYDIEGGDLADPLFTQQDGKGYYDTTGKKGYLLILRSKSDGNNKDVIGLKDFFHNMLGFEIDDETTQSGPTLQQIKDYIDAASKKRNGFPTADYYCFICVILCHGNEIKINDEKEKRKFLDESRILSLTGKPKIFFLCGDQMSVDQADDDRDEEGVDIDESDKIHKIPTDADCLLAYTTTSGTYFLRVVNEVLEMNYRTLHLEEMLIKVREKFRNTNTWTTLTKRLSFTPA